MADKKIISRFKHQKFTRKIERTAYSSTLLMLPQIKPSSSEHLRF